MMWWKINLTEKTNKCQRGWEFEEEAVIAEAKTLKILWTEARRLEQPNHTKTVNERKAKS